VRTSDSEVNDDAQRWRNDLVRNPMFKPLRSGGVFKVLTVFLILALALTYSFFVYRYVSNINDYISDECWYVSSARNILSKYFGLTPRFEGDEVLVTVELTKYLVRESYYSEVRELKSYVAGIGGAIIKDENYYQFKDDGKYLPAICVKLNRSQIPNITKLPYVVNVAMGYCYPTAENILNYLNFEHPPLVKYLIALAMATVRDEPGVWRIPSIIAGALTLAFVVLTIKKVVGNMSWIYVGMAAAVITALDPTFRSMSMVAMLDIFVALFTVLTLYFTLSNSLIGTSVALGLGIASKLNAAFAGVPAVLVWVNKEKPAKALLYLIYIPIALFLMFNIPFIVKDGFLNWWGSSVEGAIRWHLSVKTTEGPPQSMPWEWLIGRNPFVLHYVYDPSSGQWIADIIASGNPALYLLTVALSIFILPSIKDLPDKGLTYIFTWVTYLMYIVMWVVGGKTQYSFYSVQVVPLIYTLLLELIYYLLSSTANIRKAVGNWVKVLKVISDWLAGKVKISIKVVVQG